ncbi:MAG: 50S ribosomal protein L11 methyltransferase [Candidatus Sericytochromatia bacterium]|nr:50S ribosomal protein L11 methyltransferase [Candidatus Sericytochromatia bacterium]
MDYTEVSIQVAPWHAETVAWHLQGLAGQGAVVSEVPAKGDPPETLEVKLYRHGAPEQTGEWVASVEASLDELRNSFQDAAWSTRVRLVPSEDWENSWKRHWHALEIGERLVVKPTWEAWSGDSSRLVIDLDPAQAFGTGTHPTTQLCLRALERVLPQYGTPRVFDVGTGSGILAIAALLLGAEHVWACDIDPVAVESTRENAERNRVEKSLSVATGDVTVFSGQAPILLANILAEVIAPIAPDLGALLSPGGTLIASGIIRAREALVSQALQNAGLEVTAVEYQGEWVMIEARKPAAV